MAASVDDHDNGEKHTRFPCLTTVRYMLAAVLTIVAVVKVVTTDLSLV